MDSKKISTQLKTHFKQVLGRELPADGLQHFLELIKNGKMTLQDVIESISGSPEHVFLKTKKFVKNAPTFKSSFTDEEIKKKLSSVKDAYHTFKFNNLTTSNTRTDLAYQMWTAQGIPLDLSGKTVLDIGTADGFYSFLCEQRGAERVLAIDILQFEGFKVTKEILNSNVEFQSMVISDLDKINETFDYVLLFGVYYHLDNPVLALQKIFSKVNGSLFLSGHIIDNPEPIMCYYDKFEMHPDDAGNWWVASPSCIIGIAKRIGFSSAEILDSLRYDNPFQPKEIRNSIRGIRNVGIFRFSKK